MCLWNELFALELSVESENLGCFEWWWLGGIYSPNHYSSRWLGFLSTDTPDSPVRIGHPTVHCPVLATLVVRWNRPLDSFAPVAHRTVRWHTGQSAAT
jgi:hypothetical protein